jgi:DNA polymerase
MTDPARSPRAARAVRQQLESLGRAGVTHLPRPRRGGPPPSTPAESLPVAVPAHCSAHAPGQPDSLDAIRGQVAACQRCPHLAAQRTQTVFGVGNPRARLCFVGEAPGADEDRQGEPFVGKAGQLLTKIIEACTLQRGDVYILNVLKCRPPGNRTPEPPEIDNCREFLDRQLALIRPEFLCCLGAVAAQTVLRNTLSIGRLRGRLHEVDGRQVLCTYHPAYLLRNPAAKRDVWEDMQILMGAMGIPLT